MALVWSVQFERWALLSFALLRKSFDSAQQSKEKSCSVSEALFSSGIL